jgi:NAD(P)-dependent dehydrogenase (short-subunit alcohol dehydrogenase family)
MDITSIFPKDLFAGKTVFVTGGGSGINLGIAKTFARLGARLALCGRSQERLDGATAELRELGAKTFAQSADVRDYAALESAMNGAKDALGPIDVLVVGAAGNFPAAAEVLSPNGFKAVVDIDLLGGFNACRAAFAQLKETQGSITFISAGQAFIPYAYQAHVGAAKAGVDNLMRNLALEWGKHGIRVNSVAPGPIDDTEGMRRLAPSEEIKKKFAGFLASPLASYVSGTLLVADGGQNLLGSGVWAALAMGGV